MQKNIIGVDLGATSGRVILARAGDDRLRMEELHRFPNRMREIDGRFYWDIHALYEEILRGLSVAGGRGERIDSIGLDTWGVDFATAICWGFRAPTAIPIPTECRKSFSVRCLAKASMRRRAFR